MLQKFHCLGILGVHNLRSSGDLLSLGVGFAQINEADNHKKAKKDQDLRVGNNIRVRKPLDKRLVKILRGSVRPLLLCPYTPYYTRQGTSLEEFFVFLWVSKIDKKACKQAVFERNVLLLFKCHLMA